MGYLTNPFIGSILKMTCGIGVDRADPKSREKTKKAIFRRCVDSQWPQTVIFPEGCCTNGTAVVQFKLGAFAPGVAVQPVVFRYRNNRHDPSFTYPLNTGSYMLNLLLSFNNQLEVEYLPVYKPNNEEARNPSLYAAGVQRVIARALGVPTTKHAAEDVALCIAAQKLNLPYETGIVHWQAVTEGLTGMHVHDAKKVLQQFRAIDKEGTGRIDFDTFAQAMRNRTRTGSFDFRSNSVSRPSDVSSSCDGAQPEVVFTNAQLHNIFDLLDTSRNMLLVSSGSSTSCSRRRTKMVMAVSLAMSSSPSPASITRTWGSRRPGFYVGCL